MEPATDHMPAPLDARRETLGGLAKGLAIIEMFGAGAGRITVAEAARGAGATRAAARRCLLTLEQLGYVAREGRHFVPRARLRRLGGAMGLRAALIDHAEPILTEVRDRLEETSSLAVLEGRDALFIARVEARRIIQTGVRLGGRIPAYGTAAGRLLLGGLSDEEVRAYLRSAKIARRSPRSIVNKDQLFEIIAEGRKTGVCYNDEELELGMRAMAVSVRQHGQVVAAIGLSTLTTRASLVDMAERFYPALAEAAARLGQALD